MNFFLENSHFLDSSVSKASVHGSMDPKFESRFGPLFLLISFIIFSLGNAFHHFYYFFSWKYISYMLKTAVLYEKILFHNEIKLDRNKNEGDYY